MPTTDLAARLDLGASLARHAGLPADVTSVKRLRGGLVSESVHLVTARTAAGARERAVRVVVKRLRGEATREAHVYVHLVAKRAAAFAPRLLGVEWHAPDACDLYLEYVVRRERWPWRDAAITAAVLERLAAFHALPLDVALAERLAGWDYAAELRVRAAETLGAVEAAARAGAALAPVAAHAPAVRRVVEALPRLRRQLLAPGPHGAAALHGDVHPGNVVVRGASAGPEPVLLDWGRARVGSPLEDVASWLQSLRRYEPEALRRHDTILRAYLVARGLPPTPSGETRERYWIAAASNVLAGALAYHVDLAVTARTPRARAEGIAAARDALRVVRRADACTRA